MAYYNLDLTRDTSNLKVLNVWILPLGNVCIDNCNGYFLFFECCFYFSLHGTPVSWRWSVNLVASTNLYILPWWQFFFYFLCVHTIIDRIWALKTRYCAPTSSVALSVSGNWFFLFGIVYSLGHLLGFWCVNSWMMSFLAYPYPFNN